MTTSPLVSVIIPLYNGGRFIDETIERVLAQTHRRLEVLVVDDGSTDDGLDRARSWTTDDRVHVLEKSRMGIAATRNYGLSHLSSESDYVSFLDQDDVWPDDFLATALTHLTNRPDAVATAALANLVDPDGAVLDGGEFARQMVARESLVGRRLVPTTAASDVEFEQLFLHNRLCPPSCLVFRRSAIDAVGGLDESYQVADDWDLVLRSLRLGPVVLLEDVRVGYRRHDSNASSGTDRNIRETRQVWARTYFSAENGMARRSRLRRIWRAHQRRTARMKVSAGLRAVRHGDLVTGALAGLDGIAHLLLPRPLRRWAKGARRAESHHPRRAEVLLRRKAKAATSTPSMAPAPPASSGH